MQPSILVGGHLFDCDAPVIDWLESGLHFPLGRRRIETRFVVNHWTGSENEPRTVVANMTRGRKAVHFIVDPRGTVYQCCDADMRGAHAAENDGNDYGVGIEYVGRGHDTKVPTRGIIRPLYVDTVHRQRIKYAGMTPAQVASAVALNRSLCRAYGLPSNVPMDARTGNVFANVLPPLYLERFRGILGHLHLDAEKVDPGLNLLRELDRALNDPPPTDVA